MPVRTPVSRLIRGALAIAPALLAAAPLGAQTVRPAPEAIALAGTIGTVIPAPAGAITLKRAHLCGTAIPAPSDLDGVHQALGRWRDEHLAAGSGGTIRVAVHIISAGGEGDVSNARLGEQIQALNRDYAASGYRFELVSVDRTDKAGWLRMTPASPVERKAKQALATDPARHLNLYVTALGGGLLGWATYPWSEPEDNALQGVVIDASVLPGGAVASETGHVASHEIGHYLGLLPADGLEDAGTAPGAGQFDRMREIVPVYRPSLFTAPPAASTKPEISPAAGAETEEAHVLSYRGAFPNPFRAETALRFTLPASETVSLRVYSVTGQLVRTLVEATLPAGDHSAMFRADGLPSGAYFAVLKAGNVQMSRTLMLIR